MPHTYGDPRLKLGRGRPIFYSIVSCHLMIYFIHVNILILCFVHINFYFAMYFHNLYLYIYI